jgi:hypothetical protein
MCVYNRTYICYGYRQPYHHHTKYIYMWTLRLHQWDIIFCRYITGNNSMGWLGNSLVFRYSFMHACVCHFWRKLLKNNFVLPTPFV